jgi:hypothetical protein
LRHYVPTRGAEFKLSQDDLDFKPGFLGQSRELFELANGRALVNRRSASLTDSVSVLRLAEQLLAAAL